MNDTEKTARILRIIAGILFATLLTEVIFFIGITAYADSVNLFIPSQAVLNYRINSSGNFVSASNEGYFITNYIQYNGEADVYIYSPYGFYISKCKIAFSDTSNNTTDAQAVFTNVFVTTISQDNGYIYKVNISNSGFLTNTFVVFQLCFIESLGILNPTLEDVADIKINFTGDFTEDEPTQPTIFGLYTDFTKGIPNILANLGNALYNENGLTTIGTSLCIVGGFGTVCAIIKIIFKSLQRGK